ncbi:MAG: ABC transporter permease subunit [Oscillospiraceae bacterium]
MTFVIFNESFLAFKEIGFKMFMPNVSWRPVSPQPTFGILPIVLGTFYVSILALIPAIILGVGCSLFLIFYVKSGLRKTLINFIDILAGVPSVIFGFIGLFFVIKIFENTFSMSSGECVLSAALLLSVMLLPFVVSNCCESLENVKKDYYNVALSIGVSKEYFIKKIAFKGMIRSIISSSLMAFGRGMGETMAVMMVLGNSPVFPKLFGRAETIASLTALEMGSAEVGSLHFSAIYAANAVLVIIVAIIYILGWALKKKEEKQ